MSPKPLPAPDRVAHARKLIADRLRERFAGMTVAPDGTKPRKGERLCTHAMILVAIDELAAEWEREGTFA